MFLLASRLEMSGEQEMWGWFNRLSQIYWTYLQLKISERFFNVSETNKLSTI